MKKMNWTKRQTQWYGVFCAFIGFLIGISSTLMILAMLNL